MPKNGIRGEYIFVLYVQVSVCVSVASKTLTLVMTFKPKKEKDFIKIMLHANRTNKILLNDTKVNDIVT